MKLIIILQSYIAKIVFLRYYWVIILEILEMEMIGDTGVEIWWEFVVLEFEF